MSVRFSAIGGDRLLQHLKVLRATVSGRESVLLEETAGGVLLAVTDGDLSASMLPSVGENSYR